MQDTTAAKETQEPRDKSEQKAEKKKRKKRNKKKAQQKNEEERPTTAALKDAVPVDELFANSDQSEDEGIADYKVGGYHSVHIGEVLINRYVVL